MKEAKLHEFLFRSHSSSRWLNREFKIAVYYFNGERQGHVATPTHVLSQILFVQLKIDVHGRKCWRQSNYSKEGYSESKEHGSGTKVGAQALYRS